MIKHKSNRLMSSLPRVPLVTGLIIFTTISAHSQKFTPNSVSVAYWGEMIGHPGLKLEANYHLQEWESVKNKRNGTEIIKSKALVLSPYLAFFHHKRYQTGITPGLSFAYDVSKSNNKTFSAGIGLGYLRTYVPNTYQISEAGEMEKTTAGHNYFTGSAFVSWGRAFEQNGFIPSRAYIKPQLMYAMPNFPNAVAYLLFEVGVNYKIIK